MAQVCTFNQVVSALEIESLGQFMICYLMKSMQLEGYSRIRVFALENGL